MLTISLDGIDGCGKTTQAELLASHLRSCGLKVFSTRYIGSEASPVTMALRDILLGRASEMDQKAVELIFAANAIEFQRILSMKAPHHDVAVIDRGYLSFFAYGIPTIGDWTWMSLVSNFVAAMEPQDVMFYLDISPQEAKSRKSGRVGESFTSGSSDNVESWGEDYQSKVRAVFQDLAKKIPLVISIDATGKLEDVAKEIRESTPIAELLGDSHEFDKYEIDRS